MHFDGESSGQSAAAVVSHKKLSIRCGEFSAIRSFSEIDGGLDDVVESGASRFDDVFGVAQRRFGLAGKTAFGFDDTIEANRVLSREQQPIADAHRL